MMRRKFARRRQIGFGGQQLRLAGGELCLRLRDVGTGDLTDVETIAGLLQGLFENPYVALLNLDDGGIAQVVHVDRGARQQDRLLENPQGFARAGDLALRGTGPVGGLLAVEKRLRNRDTGAARRIGAMNLSPDDLGRGAAGRGIRVEVLVARAGSDRDARSIARKRLRHVFVDRSNLRALRIELRIVLVGADQRSLNRIGQGGRQAHMRH